MGFSAKSSVCLASFKANANSSFQTLCERLCFVHFWRQFQTQSCIAIHPRKPRFHAHPARKELWGAQDAPSPRGQLVVAQTKIGNRVLANLERSDFALLQPDLEPVELPVRRQLELRNRPIENVYFLDSGLASMVVSAGAHHNIEVAILGYEGMTGLPVLLGTDRGMQETFIQTAGSGWRIPADKLRLAMNESPSLRETLLRYAHTLVTQMAYTALANGRYKIEERLARWLLMADDRTEGSTVHLTHEFLALMLGARRAGVTVALSEFHKRGVLHMQRGVITIKDRDALEESANGSYGAPESEYGRLFGPGS
jgi:CRP-like cAMP-binding protein